MKRVETKLLKYLLLQGGWRQGSAVNIGWFSRSEFCFLKLAYEGSPLLFYIHINKKVKL